MSTASPLQAPLSFQPLPAVRYPLLERTMGPLLLMALCPPTTLALWAIVTQHDGSVLAFVSALRRDGLLRSLPAPSLWSAAALATWTALQWVLLRCLPGDIHRGPITPHGVRPVYKKNGLLAWAVSHGLLVVGFATGSLSARAFFDHFGELLATLSVGAFAFCGWLYAKARSASDRPDHARSANPVYDFFMGIELHPTVGETSVKQLINCRVSMMGWSAIVVSFCAYQIEVTGTLSPALASSALIVVAYLLKFFVWETGYFASLDIMHDRFGFYICWGVMAWVPAVYPIAQLYLAAHPTGLSWWSAALVAALGLAAIGVNYSADAQRQRVRESGGQTRVWGAPPLVIRAPYQGRDGSMRHNLLLTSGYWGIARHFHYVPEILTALAWSIGAGFSSAVPYFYVTFLTFLLFHRAYRDDARCSAKYGAAWEEYRRRVRYRIVPGLY